MVDDLGRPSGRPEVEDSGGEMGGRGDGVAEVTGRVGAAGSFFPTIFGTRVVRPGVGDAGFDGIVEGVVGFVVGVAAGLLLIVLSDDSRASSVEKPISSWENIAAVKSPMESRFSPSLSDWD